MQPKRTIKARTKKERSHTRRRFYKKQSNRRFDMKDKKASGLQKGG